MSNEDQKLKRLFLVDRIVIMKGLLVLFFTVSLAAQVKAALGG
jgi:hypothetical protein